MKKIIFLCICMTLTLMTNAQNVNPNVDPKWDNFYRNHPIREHFQGTDFINALEVVGFIPKSNRVNKDINIIKKLLLSLEQNYLRQMMINGWYHSRTYKHEDYYLLYNMTYKNISKEMWDQYCPYLLPIMDFDETVTGINSQN